MPKRFSQKKLCALHRELWNWLADNPKAWKYDWPGWRNKDGKVKAELSDIYDYHSGCFACYEKDRREVVNPYQGCSRNCPIDWGEITCLVVGTAYKGWGMAMEAGEYDKAAKYAREVANAKWTTLKGREIK